MNSHDRPGTGDDVLIGRPFGSGCHIARPRRSVVAVTRTEMMGVAPAPPLEGVGGAPEPRPAKSSLRALEWLHVRRQAIDPGTFP
jgi:hypothetical protein